MAYEIFLLIKETSIEHAKKMENQYDKGFMVKSRRQYQNDQTVYILSIFKDLCSSRFV
jgi:hypothetical protein